MKTGGTRITIEADLWVSDQIGPIHPMTECAAHVAHVAKFKESDVKIIEIQEVEKHGSSPKVEIIATSGRK